MNQEPIAKKENIRFNKSPRVDWVIRDRSDASRERAIAIQNEAHRLKREARRLRICQFFRGLLAPLTFWKK